MQKNLQILLLVLFTSIGVYAQEGVSLFGKVIDDTNGEGLIGVNIIIEGKEGGTITDIDGNFILENVIPGSYNITASYIGYATFTKSNITVISKGNDDLVFRLTPKSIEFATVEVTANPFQTSRENPVSIQRLSPEEIKTYPGGNNDIAKVVQSLPGVSGSIGGFRNDVIIRGGAPNENVYYLDGIEIPNINHFSTQGSAGGPVGLLNVDFIEGVELSSSSFGARYDNALSGVLQFDQKNGNPREQQTNLRLSASEAAFTTEGPLFKGDNSQSNTSYIVSVRRSYLQFLFKAIGLPILPDYWDFQYKVDHKIDDYNSVYLTGIGSIDDFSVNPPNDFNIEQQAVLDQVPIIKQNSNTFGVGWKKLNTKGNGVMNTIFSSNTLNNNFSAYEDNQNLEGLFLQNISKESEQKLRYNYSHYINNWSWSAGANLTYASYTNDSKILNQNIAYNTEIDFLKYGFHAQLSKTIAHGRLDVSIGIRADDNNYSNEQNKLLNTISPRASLSFILDKKARWRANASVGRYAKILPYTVLGYQNNNGEFINRDLPYIINYHSVLGLAYRLGNYIKISVEGFYKYYENYPISIKDGVSLANKGGDFSVLGNEAINSDGNGRTYGLEVLLQQKLNKNFYGILAYTLFKSEFTDITGSFLPSFWDSGNLLTFTGGYKAPRNWEFSARYRFAGQTPFAPVDEDKSLTTYPELVFDFSNLGSQRLNNYNQLDIRIDKKWNFKKLALNIYLEIQNVLVNQIPAPPSYGLDRDENGTILQPERLIKIKDSDPAFIPVLGVAVDF